MGECWSHRGVDEGQVFLSPVHVVTATLSPGGRKSIVPRFATFDSNHAPSHSDTMDQEERWENQLKVVTVEKHMSIQLKLVSITELLNWLTSFNRVVWQNLFLPELFLKTWFNVILKTEKNLIMKMISVFLNCVISSVIWLFHNY